VLLPCDGFGQIGVPQSFDVQGIIKAYNKESSWQHGITFKSGLMASIVTSSQIKDKVGSANLSDFVFESSCNPNISILGGPFLNIRTAYEVQNSAVITRILAV